MKTLKTFLEVRRPKSADERRFMDKHVVVRYPDRNGNGDDLFKAANIKTIKREKEGHGYDTGKDAKVYEAKLDEAPIKLTPGWGDGGRSMRANKAKLAGKNLPKDDDTGTPDHFSAAQRRKRGLKEHTQRDILEYFESIGVEITELELEALMEDLDAELLGELSNQTLKSYIKKAGRSATYHDDSAENLMGYAKKWKGDKNKQMALDGAAKSAVKSVKRVKGIVRAAKKIKEETQLDELSKPLLGRYIQRAATSKSDAAHGVGLETGGGALYNKLIRSYEKKESKREKGIGKAVDRLTNGRYGVKESNEELNDLFSLSIEDLSENHQAVLVALYESLDLENQINLVESIQDEEGLDEVLDFALESNLQEISQKMARAYRDKAGEDREQALDDNDFYKAHGDNTHYERNKIRKRNKGISLATDKLSKFARAKVPVKENLDESCIAGTKKISSHEGKDGHTHEIRYDKDNEEYSVHHYKDGKHLGEGPVSYHSDKAEAKDQVNYDVKNFKR